ncbi:MAG: hypothetical protein ABI551_09215 [Polyangiaceae bacterium]
MRVAACLIAVSLAACTTAPPKSAQEEVPIRSQEDIARDQAVASSPVASTPPPSPSPGPDAATCRKHPRVAGCPGVSKKGPLDNTTTRSPRLVNAH